MQALSQTAKTARIRELNDAFRRSFSGGRVTMTAGVYELPDMVKAAALQKTATFDEFNEDNDPHGEHDFGSFELCGRKFFWKIVTAQVVDLVQNRRREFARDVGSPVRASMMAQPCVLAVDRNERMSAKSMAPSIERNPPEIFWRNFIMRPSRSA